MSLRKNHYSLCLCVILIGPKIFNQDTNMWNRHVYRMFIKHIGIQKHLRLSVLVQARNFLLPFFEFKVFRHERETQFLQQTHGTFCRPQLGSHQGETKNRLPSSRFVSQLSFFQIPKSSALPGMTSFTSPVIFYLGFLLWHLWLSYLPHACVNTCTQCVHLTNPCTKRKVLSLTKPKGKIYKTKKNIKKIPPQLYYIWGRLEFCIGLRKKNCFSYI